MSGTTEGGPCPKLNEFKGYQEIQVEKHHAKRAFGGVIGAFLEKGVPVVLIPVKEFEDERDNGGEVG